jgi:hypothetical protein
LLFVKSSWTATAECAIGASLKVRVDVVHVWRNIWIVGKALHDRRSTALAVANDAPEGFDFRQWSMSEGPNEEPIPSGPWQWLQPAWYRR